MTNTLIRTRLLQFAMWHEAEHSEPPTVVATRRAIGVPVARFGDVLADLGREGVLAAGSMGRLGKVAA